MKKIITIIITAILLGALLMGTAVADEPRLYIRFANVIDMEWEYDIVSADDGLGNIWEFFGCDHFFFDDLVVMFMNDRGTPNYIYDDIVVNAYPVR